ncbi:MAG TPA: hypothetical protein VE819_11550, partial [Steroidobacteraceae bacterium]|nr:hypothetical protein [Steroidobacteraceae bacterium]
PVSVAAALQLPVSVAVASQPPVLAAAALQLPVSVAVAALRCLELAAAVFRAEASEAAEASSDQASGEAAFRGPVLVAVAS